MGNDLYVNYENIRTSANRLGELAERYQTTCQKLRTVMDELELDTAVKSALDESMNTIEAKLNSMRQFIGGEDGAKGMQQALLDMAFQYEAADTAAKELLESVQI